MYGKLVLVDGIGPVTAGIATVKGVTSAAPAADVLAITPTMAEVTTSTDTNPGNRKLTRPMRPFALRRNDPSANFANLAPG
jgi:hypothetical protein